MLVKNIIDKLILNYISRSNNHNQSMVIYNDWIGKNILIYGFYEKKLVQTIISSLDFNTSKHICLDIGANIGNHALQFSKKFESVICFEPQKKTFKILELNTFNIENIKIFNYGLSQKNQKVDFKIPLDNIGMASQYYYGSNYYIENVELKNYDELFDKEISFIKIDVEGNEIDVLNSLKNNLLKYKPVIAFELNPEIQKRKEIIKALTALNYKEFYIENEYKIEKIIKSKNLFFKIIKSVIKLITPRPKEKLISISQQDLILSKNNYSLVTTYNENSIFKLKINK